VVQDGFRGGDAASSQSLIRVLKKPPKIVQHHFSCHVWRRKEHRTSFWQLASQSSMEERGSFFGQR